MSKQPKVSIVVPIYGVEKYLHECVDSILAQTLKDIEIILVDDGSKDNCPQIVDDYAKKDKRIVAVHQPNGGYGRAVNHGIELAKGEYIGIVESDDWIAPDMYEKLYAKAKETDVDIVKSSFYEVPNSQNRAQDRLNLRILEFADKGNFKITEQPKLLTIFASIWSAIYKRNLIKKIKFVEDVKPYEDQPFAAEAYSMAKDICVLNYAGYYYRLDAIASSSNTVKRTIVNYVTQRERYRDILKKNKCYTKEIMENYWVQAYRGSKCFYKKRNNKFRKEFYYKMQELFLKSAEDGCEFLEFSKDEQKDFMKIMKRGFLNYAFHERFHKIFVYDNKKRKTSIVFFGIRISMKKKYKLNSDFIFRLLDLFFIKNPRKMVFMSQPDFSDNAREYYEYIKSNHPNDFELIWLYERDSSKNYEYINRKYHVKSLKGIFHLLTAKYVVYTALTSSHKINFKRHIFLQLWHGMPLKTLGFTEKNIEQFFYNQYQDYGKNGYFFVSSDIFKISMISCFLMNPNRVYITGQPKTDCVLMDRNNKKISNLLNIKSFSKVVIYAPTYKEATRNKLRDINKRFKNIFYLNDYLEEEFFDKLEKDNILFVVKPHPYDEAFYQKLLKKGVFNHPNIKVLFDDDMKENNLYFYELFQFANLMITDFSSIAIDWLINKKPVIFLNSLSDEYSQKRGFILEDNYEFLMPGEKADSFSHLLEAMDDALTVDSWKEKRNAMIPLLHKYCDSNASERIYEIMKGLK